MAPRTDWKESTAPDEDARFELYAKRLGILQAGAGGQHRALHAKGHGIFTASLSIGELPAELRHGLARKPGRYEALVRYSNGAFKVQSDKVGDVRGMAVKVLGVDGVKVLGSGSTQDFLSILTPVLPIRSADEFVSTLWAVRSKPLALFRLIGALGPIRPFQLLGKVMKSMKRAGGSLATKPFFSAVPIQWGPYAARYAFTPIGNAAGELGRTSDFLGEELSHRIAREPVTYALQIQFFIDEVTTPIEDPSVDWRSPYVDIGKLVIKKQDAASERGKLLRDRGERLAFDPWHALVEHKPLGDIMRARKVAYFASTQARGIIADPPSVEALLA